jgi:hypothetical protein
MAIKLTDTQLVLMSAAAQREDRCLVVSPTLKGGAARNVASNLISAGFVREVRAKSGDPIWRRDEESGASYALKLMAAGAKAIAVDDTAKLEDPGEEGGAPASRVLQPSHQSWGPRTLDPLKGSSLAPHARLLHATARSSPELLHCLSAIMAPPSRS